MADSPTGREPPTAHEQWVLLHGGQGGTSLEYQTYTSAHPFDTIVAGLEDPAPPLPPPAAVNSGILHNEVCLCAPCAVCRGGARGGKQQISQICDSSSWHHLGEGHYEGVGS